MSELLILVPFCKTVFAALLVLVGGEESRLSLCRPKDTSSLEGVLRTPAGLLIEACIRLRGENFTPDWPPPLSDPPLWRP